MLPLKIVADKYTTFEALVRNTREGVDWHVTDYDRDAMFLIAAIHGGLTEPHTAMIAKAIAGDRYSLYLFEAMISGLHIASDRFTEPRVIAQARRHQKVLTIHGCCNRRSRSIDVFVGGLDTQFRDVLIEELDAMGFTATVDRYTPGRRQANICNAGASHAGAQLEITERLRKQLSNSIGGGARLRKFVNAIRRALKTKRMIR